MATYKTRGIVVRRFNLGEADRIITFLTTDRGKLRAVAKGVRRIKSRLAGHLELFGEVEIMLVEGRNLDIITSARLQRDASAIAEHQPALAHAYLFTELIDRLVEEGVNQPELYVAAASAFEALPAAGEALALVELYMKLHFLDGLGYRPELAHCVVCRSSDASSEYFFVSVLGGIADRTCTTDHRFPMQAAAIKLWRLVLGRPLAGVRPITEAEWLAKVSLPACDDFIEYHFGRRFVPAAL